MNLRLLPRLVLALVLAVPAGADGPGTEPADAPAAASSAPPAPRPALSPAQIFRQWDADGDGRLTPAEVPRPNLFRYLDRNGDGAVTEDEAVALGRTRGRAAGTPGANPPPDQVPGAGARAAGRNAGVASGAPLPPAEGFAPRPHGEAAARAGLDPEVLARLDVEMQRHVAAGPVAGLAALIRNDGERGYFETFGLADREAGKPMPPDAIFQLMSMSKPVIAVAALTLLDEGRFTLDEPIGRHLPEWSAPRVLEGGRLVPARTAITPRLLMSHSSGLYYGDLPGAAAAAAATAGDATPGGPGGEAGAAALAWRASRTPGTTLKEFSEALARQPLKFHPGEGYQYGHSIDVLGRYLEAVAGQPLDEILHTRLFAPLGMVDTDFHVPPEKAGRLCQLYRQPRPGVLEPGRPAADPTVPPSLFLGGHGLYSTVADYERFCRMLLGRGAVDGVRILQPATADLVFENHLRLPGPQQYGLGGVVNGEGTYGWGGAHGTQFVLDRTHGFCAIFMVQTQGYRAPTYPAFLALARAAAGLDPRGPAAW